MVWWGFGDCHHQAVTEPPTTPYAYPSTPPDENCMLKCITVRGEWYQSDNNTGKTIFSFFQPCIENDTPTKNVIVPNSKSHATVTTKDHSSINKGSADELEQLRPTVPEDTVGTPVHPQPRISHTAPQPIKQLLVQLDKSIQQDFNKIQKITTPHVCTTTLAQKMKTKIGTIHQYLKTLLVPDDSDHSMQQIISTMAAPLLECTSNHYTIK